MAKSDISSGLLAAELAKEQMQLEDEVAEMEAKASHAMLTDRIFPKSPMRFLAGPDESVLTRGKIERRKRRIKEIEEQRKR